MPKNIFRKIYICCGWVVSYIISSQSKRSSVKPIFACVCTKLRECFLFPDFFFGKRNALNIKIVYFKQNQFSVISMRDNNCICFIRMTIYVVILVHKTFRHSVFHERTNCYMLWFVESCLFVELNTELFVNLGSTMRWGGDKFSSDSCK